MEYINAGKGRKGIGVRSTRLGSKEFKRGKSSEINLGQEIQGWTHK